MGGKLTKATQKNNIKANNKKYGWNKKNSKNQKPKKNETYTKN